MFDKTMTIAGYDDELWQALQDEERRQEGHIALTASEHDAGRRVMQAPGTVLTNKYAEGYPGRRYYGGCDFVDQAEELAVERAKALFGADYANVQPHSGSQANAAVYMALCAPGDTVLGMSLDAGGHLTHGARPNFSGKMYNAVQYGLVEETGEIDYDQVEALAREHRPKIVVAGFSAYSRVVDWARFAEIARSVDAWFMVDMARVAGLVAAGVSPHGRRSSSAGPPPIPACGTGRALPRSPAASTPGSWWTWPTWPVWWPRASTPTPFPTPMW